MTEVEVDCPPFAVSRTLGNQRLVFDDKICCRSDRVVVGFLEHAKANGQTRGVSATHCTQSVSHVTEATYPPSAIITNRKVWGLRPRPLHTPQIAVTGSAELQCSQVLELSQPCLDQLWLVPNVAPLISRTEPSAQRRAPRLHEALRARTPMVALIPSTISAAQNNGLR